MIEERKIRTLLILFLIVWAILLLLTACSVEKKTQRKVAYLIAHDKLDDVCSRVYPNHDSVVTKDSISFDTLFVESDPELIRDTIYKGDTVFISSKCPPVQIITKVIYRDSIIYRTNTAEVERLKGVILEKEKVIAQKDDIIIRQQVKIDKNDWWKTACILSWCAMLLGIVFRLFIYKRPI